MRNARHIGWMLASATFALGAGLPDARADDTEIFFSKAAVSQFGAPNVLIMIDTSAWMGCPVGSKENDPLQCAALNSDVDYKGTRLDAVREAIIGVLEDVRASGLSINVGLMRGNNNGFDNANAARGGYLIQEVSPLDSVKMDEFKDWLCPIGAANCNKVPDNSVSDTMPLFATVQDTRYKLQGSGRGPLTEMLFEA